MSLNIFNNIPADLSEEVFQTLCKSENVHIERIISNGQSTPENEWYDQENNEWVILLQGKAGIRFENEELEELNAGDFINIPAHKKHRVEWTEKDVETIWLAIHY